MKDIKHLRTILCTVYISFVFFALPLFFVDMYFNIATEKWLLFMISTIIFFFLMAITVLLGFSTSDISSSKKSSGKKNPKYRSVPKKPFYKNFGFCEYAVIAFLIANLISFLASVDTGESLMGSKSRHHGFINFAFYAIILIILYHHRVKTALLMSILSVTGGIVSITAISQYLSFDPIGMYKGVTAVSVHRMISTVGNMNIFAGYLCLVTPLTVYLFISSKKISAGFLYGICLSLDFAAGVCATSDSFYLGTGAGIIFMLIVCPLKKRELRRFFFAGALASIADFALISAAKYIESHHIIFSQSLKELDISIRPTLGITGKMTENSSFLLAVFAVMTALYLVMLIFSRNEKGDEIMLNATVRKVMTGLLLAAIAFIFIKLFAAYPFDNEMGSYRGFIWNLAIRDFKGAGFFRHLVGYGQESVLGLYRSLYRDEMVGVTGVIYDNVHCEPLEYLVTTGFIGLAAYLALTVGIIVKTIKQVGSRPELSLLLLPIISYFAQSFVSIAQSATTPIFFILLGLALSADRQQDGISDSPSQKNGSRTRS